MRNYPSKHLVYPIRILLAVAAIVFSTEARSQENLQAEEIYFGKTTLPLKQVLDLVEKKTSIHFSYSPQLVPPDTEIKLPNRTLSIKSLLQVLSDRYGIQSIINKDAIILYKSQSKVKLQINIKGIVSDSTSGELLAGAQLQYVDSYDGVETNQYGFYSLLQKRGEPLRINVKYIGYKTLLLRLTALKDTTVNVALAPQSIQLREVVVSSKMENSSHLQTASGSFTFSAENIKGSSSFSSEPDAIKVLQFLPGVQSGNEGTINLSVRGGSSDQNLFLLDEAVVYNPSHALSFFSVFNSDAIQSMTFHKSAIPVRYGGRLSSVIDVSMKEGNRFKRTYSGSIGVIASRFTIEGPLATKNDKTSFMLSGRYSYAGVLVSAISYLDPSGAGLSTIDFYDFNAKLNYRRNERNHYYWSMYNGHDNFFFSKITPGYALSWGNTTGTFRWNHVHNEKLFSNTTALFSSYEYGYTILNNTQYFLWSSSLKEVDVKQDYDFYLNNRNHFNFGWGIEGHQNNPGAVTPRSSSAVTRSFSLAQQQPVGTYLYFGNHQVLREGLELDYGLRYSNQINTGGVVRYLFKNGSDFPYDSMAYPKGKIEEVFHRIDPRIALTLKKPTGSFTVSFDRTTQYFHLLANSSVGLPTDIWMPSGGKINPQAANSYAFNYQRFVNKTFSGSVGVFYKDLFDILDFKDNANLFVNRYVESQLLQGNGTSYGAEFFLEARHKKLTGTVSYTWSKAMNTIVGVNNGNSFPSRYDKRHNISLRGKYFLSRRWDFFFNFVYTTGGAITLPAGNFTFEGVVFNYYTARNSFRLPDYHRLDISFRYHPQRNNGKKSHHFWSFDVYNVYNHKNPFTIYSQQVDNGFTSTNIKALYLYTIVPSLSYNFNF